MPTIITVYVDTNCFIHLRDLKDLPWQELFPNAAVVELVVAPVVVDELDRLKIERDGRTRDRSRMALRLIEQASSEPGLRLTLRQSPYEVQLRVAAGARSDWTRWPFLDPSRADDQLVASALSDQSAGEIALVSFDTGPLIRARVAGLTAFRSPESWQLPDQLDAGAEEAAKLRRELAASRATRPTLTAEILNTDEHGTLEWVIPRLPPLSAQTQQKLETELEARFTPDQVQATVSPFDIGSSLLGGVTRQQVADYLDSHAKFLKNAKAALEQLHERLWRAMHVVQVDYVARNESQVTAANLRLEMAAWDGARLIEDADGLIGFSPYGFKPPEPLDPRAFVNSITPLSSHFAAMNQDKDPTDFYWLQRAEGGSGAALQCREFRPARNWGDTLWILPGEPPPCGGVFRIELSATNLAQPLHLQAQVRVTRGQDGRWSDPRVLARLPVWMAEIIRADATD